MLPKVSIMIPTYNQEQYLAQAIESAMMQDYDNLEIIIADDCSTDKTNEIANRYTYDSRVKYFRNEKNLGRVGNYHNTLYTHTSGEWIINLDGDDYYTDASFISHAMNTILSQENVICFFAKKYIPHKLYKYKNNKIAEHSFLFKGDFYFKHYFQIGGFAHLGTLYRKDYAIKDGMCYTFNGLQSDFHAIIRLCLYGNIIISKNNGYCWRQHGDNASKSLDYYEKYKQEITCQENIISCIGDNLTKEEKSQWLIDGKKWAYKNYITDVLTNVHNFQSLVIGIKNFRLNRSYIIIFIKAVIAALFKINLF